MLYISPSTDKIDKMNFDGCQKSCELRRDIWYIINIAPTILRKS